MVFVQPRILTGIYLGVFVRFSEQIRLIVLAVFFVALILFAIVYQPVDAFSHPAGQTNGAVRPAGKR
jgi:hypothetical protein